MQKSLETNIRTPMYLYPVSCLFEASGPGVNAVRAGDRIIYHANWNTFESAGGHW